MNNNLITGGAYEIIASVKDYENKFLKKGREVQMAKKILDFKKDDLHIELFEVYEREDISHKCKITTNAEVVEFESNDKDIHSIIGKLYMKLENIAKVEKIICNDMVLEKDEIQSIKTLEHKLNVLKKDGEILELDINYIEIEFIPFTEVEIKELKAKVAELNVA